MQERHSAKSKNKISHVKSQKGLSPKYLPSDEYWETGKYAEFPESHPEVCTQEYSK